MRTREDILDEILVLRTQSGDVASLDMLARRWYPKLLRHAIHLTGEREPGGTLMFFSIGAVTKPSSAEHVARGIEGEGGGPIK